MDSFPITQGLQTSAIPPSSLSCSAHRQGGIRVGVQLIIGASVHSLTLPLPPSDFTRMQDIPEETESRDGEPVASESLGGPSPHPVSPEEHY